MVGNLQNILMEHNGKEKSITLTNTMYFWMNETLFLFFYYFNS